MADGHIETCGVEVGEPPGYYHFHACGRPGKFDITTTDGLTTKVCGTHKRVHDRSPYMKGNFVRSHRGTAS